jgi:hypothetical protein
MAARIGSRRNADIAIDGRDLRFLPDADPFPFSCIEIIMPVEVGMRAGPSRLPTLQLLAFVRSRLTRCVRQSVRTSRSARLLLLES